MRNALRNADIFRSGHEVMMNGPANQAEQIAAKLVDRLVAMRCFDGGNDFAQAPASIDVIKYKSA